MDSAGSTGTSSKTGRSYVTSEEARPGHLWNNALLNGIISGGKQEALATNMGVVSSGYRNDLGKSIHPSPVVEKFWSRQSAHDSIIIRRLYNTVSTKANDLMEACSNIGSLQKERVLVGTTHPQRGRAKTKRRASRRKSFQSEERCYLVLLPLHHKTHCHSQCHRAHRFLLKTRVHLFDHQTFRPKAYLSLQALREYLQSDHLAFQLFQLHPRCH
jgi:hypothetical protein